MTDYQYHIRPNGSNAVVCIHMLFDVVFCTRTESAVVVFGPMVSDAVIGHAGIFIPES